MLLGLSSALSLAGARPSWMLTGGCLRKWALFCHNGQRICFFGSFFPSSPMPAARVIQPHLTCLSAGVIWDSEGDGEGVQSPVQPPLTRIDRAPLGPARAGACSSPASPKELTALTPWSLGKWN